MKRQQLRVFNLPQEVDERELAGSTVIAIDLLRASTTICCALAAGAHEVVPFRTIEETLTAAAKVGRDRLVLGGERGGRRIDGFDLGNSPSEYTPKAVRGRPVYITTTNGTQALYHARLACRVFVGALVNLTAIVTSIRDESHVDILCAGTNGHVTSEDIMAAGAFVRRIQEISKGRAQVNDNAFLAGNYWQKVQSWADISGRNVSEEFSIMLRSSEGGRNLLDIGLDQDLVDCAQIDRLDVVPELDVKAWRIRLT